MGTRNDRSSRTRSSIDRKIKGAREKDKEAIKVVEEIKKVGVRNLRGDE